MRAEFAELAGHDAYEVLGLSREASDQEIKRAFRTLAKANHPDRFPDSRAKAEAEKTIRLLNAARDVLTSRRAAYDGFRLRPATRPAPPPPPPPAPPARSASSPGTPVPDTPPGRRRPRPLGVRLGLGCVTAWAGLAVLSIGIFALADRPKAGPGSRPSVAVPGRFAGTWVGVFGGDDRTHADGWTAELTLRTGRHNGDVRYLRGRCSGTAVPVSARDDRLTVRTVFSADEAGCDVGNLEFTKGRDGGLDVRIIKDGAVIGTGTLAGR